MIHAVLTALVLSACHDPAPTAVEDGRLDVPLVASVELTPAEVELGIGKAVRFTIELRDHRGELTGGTVSWEATGGTIDEDGVYVAGDAVGDYHVVASAEEGPADTAGVTVLERVGAPRSDPPGDDPAPDDAPGEDPASNDPAGEGPADDEPPPAEHGDAIASVTISPAYAEVDQGQALQFAATLHDQEERVVEGPLEWEATGGTVDDQGTYTAGASPGDYRVVARSLDGPADTAAVTVRNPPVELAFQEDFEEDLAAWPNVETCCPHSASLAGPPARSGSASLRIEARFEDPTVAGGRGRAELALLTFPVPNDRPTEMGGIGDEVWYGFSVYIPGDWPEDPEPDLVHQVKSQPDPGVEEENGLWKTPILSIEVTGDEWVVWSRSDAEPVTWDAGVQRQFPAGEVRRGVWTDFVVHARWAYDDDGRLEVWKVVEGERTKVVDFVGPTAYNDIRDFYFKIGIYKWPWNDGPTGVERRILFYDEIRIADERGDFDAVAPR